MAILQSGNSIFVCFSLFKSCLGKRWSSASAYLRPVLGRANLKTEVRCLTTKILFSGNRAVGVEYMQNGQTKRVRLSE